MCAKVKTEALEEGCQSATTSECDNAKKQRRFGKSEMKNRVGDVGILPLEGRNNSRKGCRRCQQ